MDTLQTIIINLAQQAKSAAYKMAGASTEHKNQTLLAMAKSIDDNRSHIKAENQLDIKAAIESGMKDALIDRLKLDDRRIDAMIQSIKEIALLSDPVGKLVTQKTLKNGIELRKIAVPIGVIAIIFESRPNVIADVAALCLKSGNAVVLRGGKEAEHTNRAIMSGLEAALHATSFTAHAIQMVPVSDRNGVVYLCQQNGLVDVVIPRGGEGLIKAVTDCATVPVIKHYKGVCHIYVDEHADVNMALSICHNAKCSRPSVCNAAETILVHEAIAQEFLPKLYDDFLKAHVEIRGCERTAAVIPDIKRAQESDWGEEYLDLIIAIKVVENIEQAIEHINVYGSHHSDAIVSANKTAQSKFTKEVDSAAVYVNASTRFTDGGEFGLGAEMGISTDKLHARGPMGLAELCTYKWVALGCGQVRE